MIKTLNITTQEAAALNDVYTRILNFASKSPNTAALLNITPINQERVEQVLFRIIQAKAYDGRNVYILQSNMRPAHQSSAADHTTATVADASAAHADH